MPDADRPDAEGRLFAPPPPPAADLPRPDAARFQPLRAGILNLWQYDRQEFRFHRGRLILRGENGTGKSKALELLLPFLLDADLSPQRLDPFAGVARTMAWNLLLDGRHESRVGYVWIELGRLLEEAGAGDADAVLTLGCGLRASRRNPRVDSWYFVTTQRVGGGLELAPRGVPRLKDALRQALGDGGTVYDTGREYRARVDAELFDLGEDRFSALRHLLLQLRRPHLSEKLDPGGLSRLLAESLPPVDPDLVSQLAEGFERLDDDQRELDRLLDASREVEGFLEVYRQFVRGIARQRAAGVRQADSRYHRCAAEVRQAEEDRQRCAERRDELTRREEELETAVAESTARLDALAASDAMRSAEALRARRQRADELAALAQREGEDAAGAEGERQRREETAADSRRALQEAEEERRRRAGTALDAARAARLEALHDAAFERLDEGPSAAEATVRSSLTQRHEAVEELEELAAAVTEATAESGRAEERRRDAQARLQGAVERRQEAEAKAAAAEQRLAEALRGWAAGLEVLRVDGAELEALTAEAAADRLAAAVGALARPQRDALVQRRSTAGSEAERTAAEREGAAAERAAVEAADEVPPPPPASRGGDRAGRPGAPFYRLVDFAATLDAGRRAGLEAALQASGLLDAWVTPGGRVLDPVTEDTLFVPTPLSRGPTLADLLVPVAGDDVGRPVVEALLRSVAVAGEGDDAGAGAHRVSTDGSWRLGPLRGVWSKPAAEHVGEEARRAGRRRRLDELDRALAELDGRLEELERERRELGERVAALDSEVDRLPSPEPLRATRARLAATADDEERCRAELTAAERAAGEARAALDGARQQFARRAGALGLADVAADLSAYKLALRDYAAAFEHLAAAARATAAAAGRRRVAEEELSAARIRTEDARRRAREGRSRAAAARAEVDALEATVGIEAARALERHRAEEEHREELRQRRAELRAETQEMSQELGELSGRLNVLRQNLEELDGARQEAAAGLQRLGEAGVLALVLETAGAEGAEGAEGEEGAAQPTEPPASWSFTRCLEIAREVERRTADLVELGEESASRRSNKMFERYQRLAADLGADFQLSLDQRDDLARVEAVHGGRTYDVPALLAMLRDDVETRRRLLVERERELLRRFLLGEVGDHLRGRLRQAQRLVDDMNRLLADCATASGMTLRLAWRPADDSGADVRRAVELLLRDLALLTDPERRWLEGFFQQRIERAREEAEAVPWREHLRRALDYRLWHSFTVQRRSADDGAWRPLTRRGHAAISGGEKAVALHLPLFAAAAAHYASARPEAPRLILLDEAFAGIDAGMRGRCMGLLTEFDLDFMMTSYDEWGCYAQLPGVATYHLHRDPELEGVAAVRFVWDGRQLREEGVDGRAG